MTEMDAWPALAGEGAAVLPELRQLSGLVDSAIVDGVPILHARQDGAVTGALAFRVGWADEPLARAGITHLVEHLALYGHQLADVHHNGTTGDTITVFHATGTEAEIVAFLNAVCSGLRDLPLDRMETEKEILRTEASRHGWTAPRRHRIERYGANGPALASYETFGLSAISPADVSAWAGERFTSGNAVVWLTTDHIPDALDLRLPHGQRLEIPASASLHTDLPGYFVGAPGEVLIDSVVPRSTAATLFARVASTRLFQALRTDGGYSYAAYADYEFIDAHLARISLYADALADKQAAVVGGMIDVLAALRAGRMSVDELEAARAALRKSLDESFLGARFLASAGYNLLHGAEVLGPDQLRRNWEAATVDDLTAVADLVWTDALAQIPEGDLDWAGFTAVAQWSSTEVDGAAYPRRGGGPDGELLIIGAEGVTARSDAGAVTVRFADCRALEKWPDGARRLVGTDAFQIRLEPTLHVGLTPDIVANVDAAVPLALHVPRPRREPDEIPQPPIDDRVAAAKAPTRPRNWFTQAAVLFYGLALVGVVYMVIQAVHIDTPFGDGTYSSSEAVAGGALVTCLFSVAALMFTIEALKRRNRR